MRSGAVLGKHTGLVLPGKPCTVRVGQAVMGTIGLVGLRARRAFWAAIGMVGLRNGRAVLAAIGLVGLGLGLLGGLGVLAAEEGLVLDAKRNIIQRAAQPKTEDLRKAEKLVEEVFGKDIAKARSTQEKVKLAQEILKVAREEPDMAVRFVALQAARRLAVEALDGKLGLEIVREIVQIYNPLEEMSQDDRLAEADRLWDQAEKAQGREKLAKQLEAVEYWFYADIKTGLVVKEWEKRTAGIMISLTPQEKLFVKSLNHKIVALIHDQSGLSLNIRGAAKEPTYINTSAYAMLYPDPSRNSNAQWECVVTPEGFVRFRNRHSGLWLGVYDHVNIPDVACQTDRETATLWAIKLLPNKKLLIVNIDSGLCLRPWEGISKAWHGVHLYPYNEEDPSCYWHLKCM